MIYSSQAEPCRKRMEDPFQHGMSKLGQPTGLLDKLEHYSKIGFTCLVAKGSNWEGL